MFKIILMFTYDHDDENKKHQPGYTFLRIPTEEGIFVRIGTHILMCSQRKSSQKFIVFTDYLYVSFLSTFAVSVTKPVAVRRILNLFNSDHTKGPIIVT